MAGGTHEWELAKRYEAHAEAVRDWPRTRRLFKQIAESYAAEARRHDSAAERRQQGQEGEVAVSRAVQSAVSQSRQWTRPLTGNRLWALPLMLWPCQRPRPS
jgi:hypothetical protein